MTHTPHLSLPQLQKLASPIHPGRVSQRDGMSYVEAYDVKATLIRIFGYGGFSSELIDSELLFREQVPQARNKDRMNWKVAMKATVRLTIHALNNATYTEAAVAGSSQPPRATTQRGVVKWCRVTVGSTPRARRASHRRR